MADAVATPSVGSAVNAIDSTQKSFIVRGTLAVGASPLTYSAGGLVLDLTKIAARIPVSLPPNYVRVWSQKAAASPNTAKYDYGFLPGTTMANGKLQIFVQDAVAGNPLEELPNGAVPAGVSGDTIQFEAVFARL